MEQWQKQHITSNIYKLVDNTICDAHLLLKLKEGGVLGNADVDKIEAKLEKFEKAKLLYDILETRTDGFVVLARSLAQTNQTGAFYTLMDGFSTLVLSSLKIEYCATVKSVKDIFTDDEVVTLGQRLRSVLQPELYLNLCIKSSSTTLAVSLVEDSIPPPDQLYIPRILSKRSKLNATIFKVDCSDVFVFKDTQKSNLTEHIPSYNITSSTLQTAKLTSRFILLDHEEDWEDILTIARDPVHLVKYDSAMKTFILEETSGGSRIIHQYLGVNDGQSGGSNVATITEQELLNQIYTLDGRGVCICDLPGMGKSLLLANLARGMKEKQPERIVQFIPLAQFINFLSKKPACMGADISKVVPKYLTEFITPSAIEDLLLTEILKKENIQMELFFDGFDEVDQRHVDFAKRVLTAIAKHIPNTRVSVTSRPHMRHELEATLGAISHDILPFSRENQVNFLTNCWQNSRSDSAKLVEFAHYCLENYCRTIGDKTREITGVPMMCCLLADIYLTFARKYARPTRSMSLKVCCKIEDSLSDVYKRYVDLRLCKLNLKLANNKSQSFDFGLGINQAVRLMKAVAGEGVCESEMEDIKNFHMNLALKTILPEREAEINELNCINSSVSMEKILSIGLLKQVLNIKSESLEFLHRTLAEYFVVMYAANAVAESFVSESEVSLNIQRMSFVIRSIITVTYQKNEQMRVLFLRWLEIQFQLDGDYEICTFRFPVVAHFLNDHFGKCPPNPNTEKIKPFLSCLSPETMISILAASIQHNYFDIFKILKSIVMVASEITDWKLKFQQFLSCNRKPTEILLHTACWSCSVAQVQELFSLFGEYLEFNLAGFCAEWPLKSATSLHSAILEGSHDMAEYFVDYFSLYGRRLLFVWVFRSIHNSSEVLNRKMEICRILLNKEPRLISETADGVVGKSGGPIVTFGIHLEFIKFLVQHGADVRATMLNKNVAQTSSPHMAPEDFHELCRFLINDCNAADLFRTITGKWETPLHTILGETKGLLLDTLSFIFKIPGIDLDELDDYGDNLFLAASRGCCSRDIFLLLKQNGVNPTAVNKKGENALHVVLHDYSKWCSLPSIEKVRTVLSFGIPLDQRDKDGKTPLDKANQILHSLKGYVTEQSICREICDMFQKAVELKSDT